MSFCYFKENVALAGFLSLVTGMTFPPAIPSSVSFIFRVPSSCSPFVARTYVSLTATLPIESYKRCVAYDSSDTSQIYAAAEWRDMKKKKKEEEQYMLITIRHAKYDVESSVTFSSLVALHIGVTENDVTEEDVSLRINSHGNAVHSPRERNRESRDISIIERLECQIVVIIAKVFPAVYPPLDVILMDGRT